MVCVIYLIDDTNNLRVVGTFSDNLARVATFSEERRIRDRHLDMSIDNRRGFLRAGRYSRLFSLCGNVRDSDQPYLLGADLFSKVLLLHLVGYVGSSKSSRHGE